MLCDEYVLFILLFMFFFFFGWFCYGFMVIFKFCCNWFCYSLMCCWIHKSDSSDFGPLPFHLQILGLVRKSAINIQQNVLPSISFFHTLFLLYGGLLDWTFSFSSRFFCSNHQMFLLYMGIQIGCFLVFLMAQFTKCVSFLVFGLLLMAIINFWTWICDFLLG